MSFYAPIRTVAEPSVDDVQGQCRKIRIDTGAFEFSLKKDFNTTSRLLGYLP